MCCSASILRWLPAAARAQVVGSIIGNVVDQSGMPLPGVQLSASSGTQIGGEKQAYTNAEGFFRLPGLQPGIFEVRARAPKLKTVVQQDIRVGVNAPAEVVRHHGGGERHRGGEGGRVGPHRQHHDAPT